jgi:protein SCO1/2
MTARTSRVLLVLAAFVTSLVLVFGIVMLVVSDRGMVNTPAVASVGGPFRLIDQNGNPFSDQDLKGRPFLVFFGFTHCPDVCPTTLFDVSEVLRRLGPEGDRVRGLFITIDPERDTPDKLKDYLSSFDPRLIALTGDPAAIAATAKAYRVYTKKVPLEGGNYTMDHTTIVYLMDKDGRFVAPFSLKRRPEEAAADLRRYL